MNELLNLLKQNALETPENLAKMLGISVEEVKNQIADYEKAGIIRAYQAVVNEEKLDSSLVTTVIEVKVVPESEGGFDRIADRISRFPEVESVYLMSGTFDLLLVTAVFGTVTTATMLGAVFLGRAGVNLLPIKKIQRYSHALAGASILLCGLAIFMGL